MRPPPRAPPHPIPVGSPTPATSESPMNATRRFWGWSDCADIATPVDQLLRVAEGDEAFVGDPERVA